VHFDSAVHSPRAIGRKAMNRNLSDCAAMGCLPVAAVVTVALPKGIGDEYAKELFLGSSAKAKGWNQSVEPVPSQVKRSMLPGRWAVVCWAGT
jgi:thiamine monophosphate kinase